VLDLSGNALDIGKNLGDDLSEGKPTLPLLYAMRNGTAAELQQLNMPLKMVV
jgi:octaprenyl-diphosphate synthase